jgi:hypothetical protein
MTKRIPLTKGMTLADVGSLALETYLEDPTFIGELDIGMEHTNTGKKYAIHVTVACNEVENFDGLLPSSASPDYNDPPSGA